MTAVRAQLLEGEGAMDRAREIPGAFLFVRYEPEGGPEMLDAGIVHSCPCGCGQLSGIGLKAIPGVERALWDLTGPREAPTLTPSVGIRPWRDDVARGADGFHWHGWLRAGVWTPA